MHSLNNVLFQNIPCFMTVVWVGVPPPKRKHSRNPSLVLSISCRRFGFLDPLHFLEFLGSTTQSESILSAPN